MLKIADLNKLKQNLYEIQNEEDIAAVDVRKQYENKKKECFDNLEKEYHLLKEEFYTKFGLKTVSKQEIALAIINHSEQYIEFKKIEACEDLINYNDACLSGRQTQQQWNALHLLSSLEEQSSFID